MASVGKRNKGMKEKEETKWTEDKIQKVLRILFFSPSSIRYVIENLMVYEWESDSILVTKAGYAYEFEIKISRNDFRNDFKHKKNKHLFLEGKAGDLGAVLDDRYRPNYFYYAVPEGLISEDEVPEYAGLIYVKNIISWPYFQITIAKRAPSLHKEKFDVGTLGLTDKFYYNYRNWKQSFETKFEDYKHLLDEAKSFEGKNYGLTLPQADKKIKEQEETIELLGKRLERGEESIKELARENRQLRRILSENNILIPENQ